MIYPLKITLRGTKVWRRIQTRDDITFAELHNIIQAAMGWGDSHLHNFHARGTIIQAPSEFDNMYFEEAIDESEAILKDYLNGGNDKIRYMYDFGDGWDHLIKLEKVIEKEEGNYPKCTAGKLACPPDDCGGVGGYFELLEIIKDPTHPEHKERIEWLEGIGMEDYKPDVFDKNSVLFFSF